MVCLYTISSRTGYVTMDLEVRPEAIQRMRERTYSGSESDMVCNMGAIGFRITCLVLEDWDDYEHSMLTSKYDYPADMHGTPLPDHGFRRIWPNGGSNFYCDSDPAFCDTPGLEEEKPLKYDIWEYKKWIKRDSLTYKRIFNREWYWYFYDKESKIGNGHFMTPIYNKNTRKSEDIQSDDYVQDHDGFKIVLSPESRELCQNKVIHMLPKDINDEWLTYSQEELISYK